MKSDDFYKLIETQILPKCFEIMKSKGQAYCYSPDTEILTEKGWINIK